MVRLRFDEFEFQLETRVLFRNGEPVELRPKPACLLAEFLLSEGRIMAKDYLIQAVWESSCNEQVLFQNISELRKVLGDSSRNPRFIRNVKKRGYCWIATLEPEPNLETEPEVVARQTAMLTTTPSRRPMMVLMSLAALLLTTVGLWMNGRKSPPPLEVKRIAITSKTHGDLAAEGLLNLVATTMNGQPDIEVIPAAEVRPFSEEFAKLHRNPDREALLLAKLLGLDYVVFCELSKQDEGYVLNHAMYDHNGLVSEGAIQQPSLVQVSNPLGQRLLRFFKALDNFVDLKNTYTEDPRVLTAFATGDQAMEMANFSLAAEHFERCLALDPQFQWARVRLARCHEMLGRVKEAGALNRQVIGRLDETTDPELRRLCLTNMASLAMRRRDFEEALRFRQRILADISQLEQPILYAKSLLSCGVTLLELGRHEQAGKCFRQSLALFRDQGFHLGLAHAYNNLGKLYFEKGHTEQGRDFLKLALDIYLRMGSNWYSSHAAANLSNISHRLSDDENRAGYEVQAMALARKSGNLKSLAIAYNGYALTAQKRGDIATAERYFLNGFELFEDENREDVRIALGFNLAVLYLNRKNPDAAKPVLDQISKLTDSKDAGVALLRAYHARQIGDCRAGLTALAEYRHLIEDKQPIAQDVPEMERTFQHCKEE